MTDSFKYLVIALVCMLLLAVSNTFAQTSEKVRQFCGDGWTSGNKASSRDLREFKTSGGSVTVDGKANGGVSVRGEDRSDVQVRACIQAWADTEAEAQSIVKSIRISESGTIAAEGDGKNWSVSYELLVPRNTNLKLTTFNGGIAISDVDGTITFEATNGGISLSNLAGDVSGKTMNGGLHVKLGGESWKGAGLNVETKNGGVSLKMRENYAARIEAGTVNGGFSSEIESLKIDKTEQEKRGWTNKRVSADLNGGGAPIKVFTTNGGISIKAAK